MRARITGRTGERGATTLQMLVILVPVVFAFMGFAVDLARLYLIRMELQTAANAAAMAAASRLMGTEASAAMAAEQAQLSIQSVDGYGNRYNFGATEIGSSDGFLTSTVTPPELYDTLASALGSGDGGGQVGGASGRYAKVTITADAPLLFFSFLPVASDRKTPVQASAVAGMSAPLCTACAILPVAIAAIDSSDTTDFGFVRNTQYTFGYQCTGTPTPAVINGAPRVPYILLDRYNLNATLYPDEPSQAYRIGAQGMLPTARPDSTTDPTTFASRACITVLTDENVWVNASPVQCSANRVPNPVTAMACGLATRFDTLTPDLCAGVPNVDAMAQLYTADTDVASTDDYATYAGNGRRVITVVVVAELTTGAPMQAIGFRQFLIEPNPDAVTISPGDSNARFNALYIGYPMPLKQGRFDGCQMPAGPGKVVLHR